MYILPLLFMACFQQALKNDTLIQSCEEKIQSCIKNIDTIIKFEFESKQEQILLKSANESIHQFRILIIRRKQNLDVNLTESEANFLKLAKTKEWYPRIKKRMVPGCTQSLTELSIEVTKMRISMLDRKSRDNRASDQDKRELDRARRKLVRLEEDAKEENEEEAKEQKAKE
jgi:hypothetical protein